MSADTPGRRTLAGTVRVLAAESLAVPTGLATAALLGRELGPDGYGVFGLASAIVASVEWTLIALFTRATIRAVRHADDWRPIATRILHTGFLLGTAAGALVWLAAPSVAGWIDAPALVGPLRLYALDVPLFALAFIHLSILTGLGSFGLRARAIAVRWTVRCALLFLVAVGGLSVERAVLASIGASLAELLVAMRYDRPRFFSRPRVPVRSFFDYALPLFGAAAARRVVQDVDLVAVKALGGSTAAAGHYAAARSLTMPASLFAGSFSPLLLSTLTGLERDGERDHARALIRDSLRLILLLLPFAGLGAGAAGGIVALVFGPGFESAAPILARLLFAGVLVVFAAICTTALIAGARPRWPLFLTVPLVLPALAGHWYAVPRWGAVGAATVTLAAAAVSATASHAAVGRAWRTAVPPATLLRVAIVTALAWAAAAAWPPRGALVVVQVAAIGAAIPLAFLALGEVGRREVELARSLLPLPRRARPPAGG